MKGNFANKVEQIPAKLAIEILGESGAKITNEIAAQYWETEDKEMAATVEEILQQGVQLQLEQTLVTNE